GGRRAAPSAPGGEAPASSSPRRDGESGRIGVVAGVLERGQLPNGTWVATVVGLHRGLAGAAEPGSGDELRVEVQEIHDGHPQDESVDELMQEYRAVVE